MITTRIWEVTYTTYKSGLVWETKNFSGDNITDVLEKAQEQMDINLHLEVTKIKLLAEACEEAP